MVTTTSRNGGTKNDEYYTPPEVFETLGLRFDLDVCAPQGGVPWIPADRYYTINDNGLSQPWHGRVWMNPPYSKPGPWVDKWISHGNGIALLPITRGNWFQNLWNSEAGIAFMKKQNQTKFVKTNGMKLSIYAPLIAVAIGDQTHYDAIARLGQVR